MSTASKTITRSSGVQIIVTLTRDVVDNVSYADGYNIKIGRQLIDRTEIKTIMPDGHQDSGSTVTVLNPKYDAKYIAKGAYARFAPMAFVSREAYDWIMAALAELDAEVGKSDEFLALEAAEARKRQEGEAELERQAAERVARKRQVGWCERCQDWTYGDCGHHTR
jgi:hypothetical protein